MDKAQADLADNTGLETLTLDLARAKLLQEKCFSKIVRFVRWQQKKPASGSAEQIRRDIRLCELLVEYENQSQIVGMIDFLRDLTSRQQKRGVKSRRSANSKSIQVRGTVASQARTPT